jgi:hypothetical protein
MSRHTRSSRCGRRGHRSRPMAASGGTRSPPAWPRWASPIRWSSSRTFRCSIATRTARSIFASLSPGCRCCRFRLFACFCFELFYDFDDLIRNRFVYFILCVFSAEQPTRSCACCSTPTISTRTVSSIATSCIRSTKRV